RLVFTGHRTGKGAFNRAFVANSRPNRVVVVVPGGPSRFENSRNVKMRVIQAFAEVFTTLSKCHFHVSEFHKHGSDGLTLFRTALLVPSPKTRSCASSILAVS